jgi:hypothetical protein
MPGVKTSGLEMSQNSEIKAGHLKKLMKTKKGIHAHSCFMCNAW